MKKTARQFAEAYMESVKGKDATEVTKITGHFLHIVRAAGIWKKLPAIIAEIERVRDREEGVTPLALTTARAVDVRTQEKIGRALGFKKTRINALIDADLIGGFVARAESVLYDASIRNQLHKLNIYLQS